MNSTLGPKTKNNEPDIIWAKLIAPRSEVSNRMHAYLLMTKAYQAH